MSGESDPVILIDYPSEFGCYNKFERKLSIILSNLKNYDVVFKSDPNQFIKRYFSNDELKRINATACADELSDSVTHTILFIDSNSQPESINRYKESGVNVRVVNIQLTKVVNIDKNPEYDTYIGRGSQWGNPYAIGYDGDREEVIRKFRYDFERGLMKFTKEDTLNLKGQTLGCHCRPAPCHGDVIAEYLNTLDDGEQRPRAKSIG